MESTTVVFDRYRLEERIGAGGMGVVWRATDLLLDQPVALKRVCLAGADTEQAELTRARALREARAAARLRRHPHVVATYDVLIEDGNVWLVLEYLPSRNLDALRRERGRLELIEVARIGAHVADALAAGHVQLTQDGVISGTIAYLAPEVAVTGQSTPASDVFSLGSTLYATIEGQPPFGTDDNALHLLNVVRTGIIRPPTSAGALTSLLLRLLELDPATRPDAATARDLLNQFADRMTAATEHLPLSDRPSPRDTPPEEPQTPPSPARPTRWPRPQWPQWPRRHRVLAAALVLADRTQVFIQGFGGKGFDFCKLAEVGTATAVTALAQHGVTYQPGRTAGWPITNSDACTLLTPTELTTLGGVDPTIRNPGFANWGCSWGTPAANVTLNFYLNSAVLLYGYGTPTTIADRRAWLQIVAHNNPHQCDARVVSHPAQSPTDNTEMISVTVQESQPDQKLCARASDLAALAVARVPTS